ncbi:MAG: hypothetical protein PVF33_04385 [Candidatus Latescibacterota bacterium]
MPTAADSVAAEDSVSAPADTSGAVPQRDVMDLLDQYVLRKRPEPMKIEFKRGLQWALLPTFSYNPTYGAAFGLMVSGAGRRGGEESHYSNLAISANISTTGQVQVQVRGDVFSPGEDYLLRADFRYLDTERSTWGLGPIEDQVGEFPMTFVLNRIYGTAFRRVSGPVYLGVGFHFDQFGDIVDELAQQGESTPFTEYSGGQVSQTDAVGVSVNLLADTRDNLVNAKHGYYLRWSYRDYGTVLGSDENWQELWVEARVYPHVPKRSQNVLAFWLYGWMTFGTPPYLNLPANGWDTYGRGGRGYVAGRIRGPDQIYVEAEYRRTLTRDGLWGVVLFYNGTSTTDPDTGIFSPLDHGVGFGLRIKFNKYTDTNLAIDYGWGRDGSNGLFLGMTEVF